MKFNSSVIFAFNKKRLKTIQIEYLTTELIGYSVVELIMIYKQIKYIFQKV